MILIQVAQYRDMINDYRSRIVVGAYPWDQRSKRLSNLCNDRLRRCYTFVGAPGVRPNKERAKTHGSKPIGTGTGGGNPGR
jgi:hypothetical protein